MNVFDLPRAPSFFDIPAKNTSTALSEPQSARLERKRRVDMWHPGAPNCEAFVSDEWLLLKGNVRRTVPTAARLLGLRPKLVTVNT